MFQNQKVGLALGAGSARGWAHIGIIRALREAGIEVDMVAGSSIGALVGAVHCAGGLERLEKVVLDLNWRGILNMLDVGIPRSGILDGHKVAQFVREHVPQTNIEEMPSSFCAVCTDIVSGKEVRISSGDVIEAVRASIAVPGMFTPVKRGEDILVDGGLVNPVPVNVVRDMGAEFIVGVDLNYHTAEKRGIKTRQESDAEGIQIPSEERKNNMLLEWRERLSAAENSILRQVKQWMVRDRLPNVFEIIFSSLDVVQGQISETKLENFPPDILIRPRLGSLRFMDFNRGNEAIAEGYLMAKKQVDAYKKNTVLNS